MKPSAIRKGDIVLMKLGQTPVLAEVFELEAPGLPNGFIADRATDGQIGSYRYRAYERWRVEKVYREVQD